MGDKKSATAEVSCGGMGDGECETSCGSSIECVATFLHDVDANLRCIIACGDDHAVLGGDGGR